MSSRGQDNTDPEARRRITDSWAALKAAEGDAEPHLISLRAELPEPLLRELLARREETTTAEEDVALVLSEQGEQEPKEIESEARSRPVESIRDFVRRNAERHPRAFRRLK